MATLGFDDLTGDDAILPNGYGGLNYTNVYSIGPAFASLGGVTGYADGSAVIFNGFGQPASIRAVAGSFNLVSFDLNAAFLSGLSVSVTGLRNGVVLHTATFAVDVTPQVLEVLGWTNLDEVDIATAGGTKPAGAISDGPEFVIDNLSVTDGRPAAVDTRTDVAAVALNAGPSTPAFVVVDNPAAAAALDALVPDAMGTLGPPAADAVIISNTTGVPATVAGSDTSPVFFEVASGSETVLGGAGPTTIIDASHDTAALRLAAGSGSSRSFIIGGSGADTISGSGDPLGEPADGSGAPGVAVLVAGSGRTVMFGERGADSLYGGGRTSMVGGGGGGQLLAGGFSAAASDTLRAGGGGHQTLAVAQGANLLDDTSGTGTDTLFSGAGADTLIGGIDGAVYALGLGETTVQGGTGFNNIVIAPGAHGDVIDGGGGTTFVTFVGYSHDQASVTMASNGVTTVSFASGAQSATLTRVQAIFYGNDA